MPRELGRLMVSVFTSAGTVIPAPGTRHERPPLGWDPDLEGGERDLRIGEVFAKRLWGHRKVGNLRRGENPPDLIGTDLGTGGDVTIELTQVVYEHLERTLQRGRRFRQAFYEAVVAERPRFRGKAVTVYFSEGKVAPARGKASERVLRELIDWMRDDPCPGHLTATDPTAYPTLSKYVRQLSTQPASEHDYRHDPSNPLVVTITGAGGRTYGEGDLPALFRRAMRRKLKRGYSCDFLVLHNGVDPFVLSSAPEAEGHRPVSASSRARPAGIPDVVVSLGRAVARETGVGRQFGQTWLLALGLHESLRRLDP